MNLPGAFIVASLAGWMVIVRMIDAQERSIAGALGGTGEDDKPNVDQKSKEDSGAQVLFQAAA